MTAALFLVILAVLLGIFNFRKTRKTIERMLDREVLHQARQEVSVFEEYSKENKKKTAEKLKKLKKMKKTYTNI